MKKLLGLVLLTSIGCAYGMDDDAQFKELAGFTDCQQLQKKIVTLQRKIQKDKNLWPIEGPQLAAGLYLLNPKNGLKCARSLCAKYPQLKENSIIKVIEVKAKVDLANK